MPSSQSRYKEAVILKDNDGSIGLKPEKRIRIPVEIQSILDSL